MIPSHFKNNEAFIKATKFKDLTGMVFGKWTVIQRTMTPQGTKYKDRANKWLVRCECGKEAYMESYTLTKGKTNGCRKCADRSSTRLGEGVAMFNALYQTYVWSAKDRGYSFDLTKDQFGDLTKQNCFYCGTPPSQSTKNGGACSAYIYNGVDRIDNKQGYCIDNVVSCCGKCNTMKMKMTITEFLSHVQKIMENTKIMFVKLKTA